MRHERSDRPSGKPAGQSLIFIFKFADGKTPVEDDLFDRFVPGEQAIGEVVRLGPHSEFSDDRTTTRLFRPDPERQRAGVDFTVISLSLPADLGQPRRIGDLPIMKFAVGHELNAARSDAAERDSAGTWFCHDDFCHFISFLSKRRIYTITSYILSKRDA